MPRASGQSIAVNPTSPEQQIREVDFGRVIPRRGTGSLKFDSAQRLGYPDSLLPLWVADMDFPAPPPVLDALKDRAGHGIFGYTEPWDGYYQSIIDWWQTNHRYKLQKEWILDSPGVVFSISTAIRALTQPGDSVLIQPPVYHPFFDMVRLNNRRPVTCPLVYTNKEYSIDFDAFRRAVEEENIKLFILCNPHNPAGRVWSTLELQHMGNICYRSGVSIVADEIHCDITAPGFRHSVFAGLGPRLEQITVTLTSPSKTFNLSGLQISHAFIANAAMRSAWQKEKEASGYGEANIMGLVACQTAYEKCRPWLDRLLSYINENEEYVREFLNQYIPGVYPVKRQGTYLLWLDCWGTGFTADELKRRLIEKGKLRLSDGRDFGRDGEGFQRLNLACPRETLSDAMLRMAVAFGR